MPRRIFGKLKAAVNAELLLLCAIVLLYLSIVCLTSPNRRQNRTDGHDFNITKLPRINCRRDLAEALIGDEELTFEQRRSREVILTQMVTLRDVFSRNGVPLILGFGTLLGWYRECRLLPFTADVDVLLLHQHYTPQLEQELWSLGEPWMVHTLNRPDYYYEMVMKSHAYKFDIFLVYNNYSSGQSFSGGFAPDHSRRPFRWVLNRTLSPDQLCSARLHDFTFAVPCNVEGRLVDTYGSEWMARNETFDWLTGPRNFEQLPEYTETEVEHMMTGRRWFDWF